MEPEAGIEPTRGVVQTRCSANGSFSGVWDKAGKRKPEKIEKDGAQGRIRTDDLRFTEPLLNHLSYLGEWLRGEGSNLNSRVQGPVSYH